MVCPATIPKGKRNLSYVLTNIFLGVKFVFPLKYVEEISKESRLSFSDSLNHVGHQFMFRPVTLVIELLMIIRTC